MNEKPDRKAKVYTLKELARLLDCTLEGNGEVEIAGVSDLEGAGPGDLVYLAHPKYRKALEGSKASAAILPAGEPAGALPVLRSAEPHLAFVRAVELFFAAYRPRPGIHPTAVIAPSAKLGAGVAIGAFTVVAEDVEVGEGTVLFPLVSVYPGVKIGKQTVIHSHVSLRERVKVGDRVVLHNGVVVGGDGFGYLQNPDGSHRKIPQKGTVVIEDDVEVGANSTIDRAALGATVIRRGAKIDNLVMVAHNVEVGENAVLAGQAGIAGSSKVGRNAVLAGQVGVADHVSVGDKVIVAAKSGITKDIPAGAFVAGIPHLDIKDWRKLWAVLPGLYDLVKDYKRLKARVEELEKKLGTK